MQPACSSPLPQLALVGLLLVALLICPDNTMKLTLQEAAAAQRALARAQELYDNRQDGPGGVPFLAHFYLLLAQLCAFIGKRRPGLPDSPSVSRVGPLCQRLLCKPTLPQTALCHPA
jgi:hypothetical protein